MKKQTVRRTKKWQNMLSAKIDNMEVIDKYLPVPTSQPYPIARLLGFGDHSGKVGFNSRSDAMVIAKDAYYYHRIITHINEAMTADLGYNHQQSKGLWFGLGDLIQIVTHGVYAVNAFDPHDVSHYVMDAYNTLGRKNDLWVSCSFESDITKGAYKKYTHEYDKRNYLIVV